MLVRRPSSPAILTPASGPPSPLTEMSGHQSACRGRGEHEDRQRIFALEDVLQRANTEIINQKSLIRKMAHAQLMCGWVLPNFTIRNLILEIFQRI